MTLVPSSNHHDSCTPSNTTHDVLDNLPSASAIEKPMPEDSRVDQRSCLTRLVQGIALRWNCVTYVCLSYSSRSNSLMDRQSVRCVLGAVNRRLLKSRNPIPFKVAIALHLPLLVSTADASVAQRPSSNTAQTETPSPFTGWPYVVFFTFILSTAHFLARKHGSIPVWGCMMAVFSFAWWSIRDDNNTSLSLLIT